MLVVRLGFVTAVCPVIRGIMVAIAVLGVIELPQGWLGKGVHGPFEASSI
jgi:hypothetical protein